MATPTQMVAPRRRRSLAGPLSLGIILLLISIVSVQSFNVHQTTFVSPQRRASASSSSGTSSATHVDVHACLPSFRAAADTRLHANGRKGSGGEYRNDHADGDKSSSKSSNSDSNSNHASIQQQEQQYLATCIPGCAEILANELIGLNCWNVDVSGNSAVLFTADTETALSCLLWTRTAHKIMELMCESSSSTSGEQSEYGESEYNDAGIYNRDDLYKFVRRTVDVKDLLGDGAGGLLTLSVQTILNGANRIPADINHSHYTALTIKNALTDAVRDLREDRPNVDLENPDVPLVAVLLGTDDGAVVSLYRQLHPTGTLHKRGYRRDTAIHKAAMKESMAAALLLHAGWPEMCQTASYKNRVTLLDPMAGSGSLLLEAACIAGDVAPGLMRIKCGMEGHSMPPVVRWKAAGDDPDAVKDIWKRLLTQATTRAKQGLQQLQSDNSPIEMIGNDIHPGALDLFEAALHQAGLTNVVQVTEGDCLDWNPVVRNPDGPWMIVSNPPWDVRLTGDMHTAWEAMRVFLRETVPSNTNAWVLSGNPAATKHLGLRKTPSTSLALKTGEQDLRWIQYVIRDKNAVVAAKLEEDGDGWGTRGTTGGGDEFVERRDSPAQKPPKSKPKQLKNRPLIKDADNAWLID
jgi:putative N6-adenine-specific DNA methylase